MVHRIDQQAGGQILADDLVTNLRSSDRYLVSSLVEEAITSSQLEGACTMRQVAKETRRNRVAHRSARTDLLGLEELGLLTKQKIGKKFVFRTSPDFRDRLQALRR